MTGGELEAAASGSGVGGLSPESTGTVGEFQHLLEPRQSLCGCRGVSRFEELAPGPFPCGIPTVQGAAVLSHCHVAALLAGLLRVARCQRDLVGVLPGV